MLLGCGVSGLPDEFYSEQLCRRLYDVIQRMNTVKDSRLLKNALLPMFEIVLNQHPIILRPIMFDLSENESEIIPYRLDPLKKALKVAWKFDPFGVKLT